MTPSAATKPPGWPELSNLPGWIRVAFWLSILIAVAAVVRRVVALQHPSQSAQPQFTNLDTAFASHTALTLAHIIPALAFVLLVPFVFVRRFSGSRWPERLLFPLGAVVGFTAYAMDRYTIGGWLERSAVLLFNTLFLFSLVRAYLYRRDGNQSAKRRWLIRAVGILLGIATTRPIMAIFFATSSLTHLTPDRFFGIAFWLGVSINALTAEWWLRRRATPSP